MTFLMTDRTARAPLEPLLTVEDLEELLRVDRRTVSRLCKRGLLPPPLKIGSGNRWCVADIAEVIETRRRGHVDGLVEELASVT